MISELRGIKKLKLKIFNQKANLPLIWNCTKIQHLSQETLKAKALTFQSATTTKKEPEPEARKEWLAAMARGETRWPVVLSNHSTLTTFAWLRLVSRRKFWIQILPNLRWKLVMKTIKANRGLDSTVRARMKNWGLRTNKEMKSSKRISSKTRSSPIVSRYPKSSQ